MIGKDLMLAGVAFNSHDPSIVIQEENKCINIIKENCIK